MTAEDYEGLAGELAALGRTLVVDPPPPDLAARVLARVSPVCPAARDPWWRRLSHLLGRSRRRLVAVGIAALLVALVLTPPVRAQLLEWLQIGGVIVRTAPAPTGSGTPQPPRASGRTVTLGEARGLVGFEVGVPTALGEPERVTVSDDLRVVGMDWGTGTDRLHLDQFDGRLSWVYLKQSWSELEPVPINGAEGVWFATAHRIVYIDAAGAEHTAEARLAGPTVVWERPSAPGATTTLRLEGAGLERAEAIRIAESVR